MLNFSKADLSDGAQEKVVAAADFRGPKPREARSKTDLFILPFIFLGLLFCCYCSIAPHITGEPGYYKLIYGTNYAGETCDGSKKMLYPIHRTGVGACTDRCPTAESAESVNGHDPQDKSKMVCMSKEDFASTQFTKASEAGKTDWSTLTPIDAYRFGICNYKYRTLKVANRCYFRDEDVARRYPFKLPTSKAVIFAQSVFEGRLFIIFFCGLGAWAVSSLYLFFVQNPSQAGVLLAKQTGSVRGGSNGAGRGGRSSEEDAEKATLVGGGGIPDSKMLTATEDDVQMQSIRCVWIGIFCSALAMLVVGSHLWYTAAYYDELAVNPRTFTESVVLRILGIILWVLAAFWLWTMLIARHAVTLGVSLVMVSVRSLEDVGVTAVYWLSFVTAVLSAFAVLLMTTAIVSLSTAGGSDFRPEGPAGSTGAGGYEWGYRQDYPEFMACLAIVFATFWFGQAMSDVTALATTLSVCDWFFTRDKFRYLPKPFRMYGTVLQNHLGTAVLGALVHSFTDAPHRALATLERSAAAHAVVGGDGKFKKGRTAFEAASATVVACISRGSCGLVEHILKYTSANAYTSVAMFGTSYWTSAKRSFYLVTRHTHLLGRTISVAQIIPFVGKVAVTSCCTAAFYCMQVMAFPNHAISMVCATSVAAITSWVIASNFMAPLTQAPTALLQCYMLDEELFLHNSNERYADKVIIAWIAAYGGEFILDQ